MSWIGGLAVFLAAAIAVAAVAAGDVFVLSRIGFADPKRRAIYAGASALVAFLAAIVSLLMVVGFYGLGLIVAMDKGYDTGEKYLYAGVLSLLVFPLAVFAGRTLLFRLCGLGGFGKGALYSALAAAAATFVLSAAVLVALGIFLK
ncbi:MAG: hypothetical protein J5I65_03115 [Aridibacter famidurans]|nr:hypothetical protein [Aridibacter famidurans]